METNGNAGNHERPLGGRARNMTMTFTEGTMCAALLLPSFAFFLSVSARPAAAVARLA